jgi:hypothetical protein
VSLFNISVLHQFIEAYTAIRKHKNKGKVEDDSIDIKCGEMKSLFATAGDAPEKWIDIIISLGEIADNAQNQKTIHRLLPTAASTIANFAASYLPSLAPETQSDLGMNFHGLRRLLLNTILHKKFTAAQEVMLQTVFRAQLQHRILQLKKNLETARENYFATHDNPNFTQAEVDTKQTEYFKLLKQLAYLGDLSNVFDKYALLFPTFDCPHPNALGTNAKEPLERFNDRKPWILHDNYDTHYIAKIMQETNRNLIKDLMDGASASGVTNSITHPVGETKHESPPLPGVIPIVLSSSEFLPSNNPSLTGTAPISQTGTPLVPTSHTPVSATGSKPLTPTLSQSVTPASKSPLSVDTSLPVSHMATTTIPAVTIPGGTAQSLSDPNSAIEDDQQDDTLDQGANESKSHSPSAHQSSTASALSSLSNAAPVKKPAEEHTATLSNASGSEKPPVVVAPKVWTLAQVKVEYGLGEKKAKQKLHELQKQQAEAETTHTKHASLTM